MDARAAFVDNPSVPPIAGGAQWAGIRAAWATGELLVVKGFVEECRQPTVPGAVAPHLLNLCRLFSLWLMEKNLADVGFLGDGYVTVAQAALVRAAVAGLIVETRPVAIGLCDALGW
jgi:hypothetical protein